MTAAAAAAAAAGRLVLQGQRLWRRRWWLWELRRRCTEDLAAWRRLGLLPAPFFVAPAADASSAGDTLYTRPVRGLLRASHLHFSSLPFASLSFPSFPTFATSYLRPAIPAPPSVAPGALSRLFTWPAAAEEANALSATTSANPAAPEAAPVDLVSAAASAAADAPADPASGAASEVPVDADSSSTIEEFRERLRWLNAVTAAAQEELNAIAPPPLKSALDGAVRTVKETDVGPAVEVVKRVVGDLQEGFSGLFSAAKDFDAATTTAELRARMDKELEMRKADEDARAAAAASAAAAAVEQAAASTPTPPAAPAPAGPPAAAQ
jgi:hypothetical protein